MEMHVDGPPEQSGAVNLSTGLVRNDFAGQTYRDKRYQSEDTESGGPSERGSSSHSCSY
jgi:hypothetical protein